MSFLSKMLSVAAFLVVAACSGNPAFAQQGCISLDAILTEAKDAAAAGADLHVLDKPKADIAMKMLTDMLGPPPRPIDLTSAVLLVGPGAAVLVLVEQTQACFSIALPRQVGLEIVKAAEGVPA